MVHIVIQEKEVGAVPFAENTKTIVLTTSDMQIELIVKSDVFCFGSTHVDITEFLRSVQLSVEFISIKLRFAFAPRVQGG